MKHRKSERGESLLMVLVAIALLGMMLAMVGQTLTSVMQGSHESQVKQGIADIMVAESLYKQLYGSYATDANATKLSTCPTGGPPTVNQACLLSAAFTNGGKYNEYAFSIVQDGTNYVAAAAPNDVSSGRLTFCGSNDGLVHGIVSKIPPSLTTAAACDALPALIQGATPPSTMAYSTTGTGILTAGNSVTAVTLTLPAGIYQLTSPLTFSLSKTPTVSDPTHYVTGSLLQNGVLVQTMTFLPSGQPAYDHGTFATVATLAASGQVTLLIANHEDGGGGQINNMAWQAALVAQPVSQIVAQ